MTLFQKAFALSAIGISVVSVANWQKGPPFATAEILPRSGSKVNGKLQVYQAPDGIVVGIDVRDISPGEHGIHIHEKGDCSAQDASSAGEHFNPLAHKHGGPESSERHPGDFGNIRIPANGIAKLEIRIKDSDKGFTWNQIIGKSIIIHAGKDDLVSQPSGNSGDRIACGVIRARETIAE